MSIMVFHESGTSASCIGESLGEYDFCIKIQYDNKLDEIRVIFFYSYG